MKNIPWPAIPKKKRTPKGKGKKGASNRQRAWNDGPFGAEPTRAAKARAAAEPSWWLAPECQTREGFNKRLQERQAERRADAHATPVYLSPLVDGAL